MTHKDHSFEKFRDESGETQHGVSVTIREEVSAVQFQRLFIHRQQIRAAKIIANFLKRSYDKRHFSTKPKFWDVFDRMAQGARFKNIQDRSGGSKMKMIALSRAKESYERMIENEELGEICVVEKCFLFIGTTEQSLILNALKQIATLERMVSFNDAFSNEF